MNIKIEISFDTDNLEDRKLVEELIATIKQIKNLDNQ